MLGFSEFSHGTMVLKGIVVFVLTAVLVVGIVLAILDFYRTGR
jgi:hypothetical protein